MPWKIDQSWTVFLDRDGVINHRIMGGYVLKPEEFHLLPHSDKAIAIFNKLVHRVVVVTNQQCIGKKITSERNLSEVHRYMCELLKETDAFVDKVYFAPELASDPNNTRKPKPDMALKAKSDFPEINFEKAIMVGDTDSDIRFGKNLGMKTVRVKTEEPIGFEADLTVDSLYEFAQLLKESN